MHTWHCLKPVLHCNFISCISVWVNNRKDIRKKAEIKKKCKRRVEQHHLKIAKWQNVLQDSAVFSHSHTSLPRFLSKYSRRGRQFCAEVDGGTTSWLVEDKFFLSQSNVVHSVFETEDKDLVWKQFSCPLLKQGFSPSVSLQCKWLLCKTASCFSTPSHPQLACSLPIPRFTVTLFMETRGVGVRLGRENEVTKDEALKWRK